jgi:uncharacterized membrane protein YqjE
MQTQTDHTAEAGHGPTPGAAFKRIAQRLLLMWESRLELLRVEIHEERLRILTAAALGVGAAALGLLTGVALTLLVAVVAWDHHPAIALAVLGVLYAVAAFVCFYRLKQLMLNWRSLPGTLDQLKKDREWLEKSLN